MIGEFANFFRGLVSPLTKPIFLVGCGKSGTTLVGSIFHLHPEIGSEAKIKQIKELGLQNYLNDLTNPDIHGRIAHEMEDKPLWDRFFPMNGTDLRIGKELALLRNPLGVYASKQLIGELSQKLSGQRYFSKQPFNTFRIHALRELFPDCKIIGIHRDGRDVVSSWGRESNRWDMFGGYSTAIDIFSKKWNEAIDHIERFKTEVGVETIRYEDFLDSPLPVLRQLFDFCELDCADSLFSEIALKNQVGKWKGRIPEQFHDQLEAGLNTNLRRLNYECRPWE